MRLQKNGQDCTRHHHHFHLESIQLGIIRGPVLGHHGMDDQSLRGDEEDFHDQVVDLDEGTDVED